MSSMKCPSASTIGWPTLSRISAAVTCARSVMEPPSLSRSAEQAEISRPGQILAGRTDVRQVDHVAFALIRVPVADRAAAPLLGLGRETVEVLPVDDLLGGRAEDGVDHRYVGRVSEHHAEVAEITQLVGPAR